MLTTSGLHHRLAFVLQERADGVPVASGQGARRAVRRRFQRLHRRRRVRHALGSGTLAATVVAGGLQLRNGPTTTPVSVIDAPPLSPGSPDAMQPVSYDPVAGVDREMADPGVVHAEGRFWVHATSTNQRVPVFVGDDLAKPARLVGDAMPDLPPWVAPDDPAIWAPQAARVGDRYVLYFAATSRRPGDGRMKCLGAAVGASPAGPFQPLPRPLWCNPGYWAIDPYPVSDGDRWYLLWRQDAPGHETGTIVAAPMSNDGLTVVGRPRTLLVGEHDWEDGYPGERRGVGPIENPAMVRHPATGEWLLTWSANLWETPAYATGLAVCAGPLGPCERRNGPAPWVRTSGDPAVSTSARWAGGGGLSFAVGDDRRVYAVLHGYRAGGQHPDALRVGWSFEVVPDGSVPAGYRLVEPSAPLGNQGGGSSVSGA